MKLNIDLIADMLRKHFDIVDESVRHEELFLEQMLLLTDKKFFLEGKVYVAEGSKLPIKPLLKGACAIVSIGTSPENYKKADCDYIELEKDVNISEVVNIIQETYDKYNKWEEKLRNVIDCEYNIEKLLYLTLPLLENPIYLHDKDFHFIAYAEVPGMPGGMDIYNVKKNGGRFSLESLNELRDTPNFEKTFETRKPTFHTDTGECSYIYDNVLFSGEYWGRLFVDERNRTFNKGDRAVIGKLRSEIERMLERYSAKVGKGLRALEQEIHRMLNGKPIDFNMAEIKLKEAGWDRKGPFYCFLLKVEEIDLRLNTIVNICENIEDKLSNSMVFSYENHIVGVVCVKNKRNVLYEIENCLHAFRLHIGISLRCDDFYEIPIYYKQAFIAIDYGIRECSSKWAHYFEEHSFSYMLDCALKEFEPKSFFPEALVKLMEHDEEKATSYVETLRSYLENDSSPARAMKELFVQRSTFLYRLDRIQEIMEDDLKDPERKLQYLMAFNLHDRFNKMKGIYR
ncbi:MAG: PucR family transcriptional regulator [Anaerovoracaceae bacterium]